MPCHVLHHCTDEACRICPGELASCTVCGGAEASMPTDCPGIYMTGLQMDAVQAGQLDYYEGAWRMAWPDVPLRTEETTMPQYIMQPLGSESNLPGAVAREHVRSLVSADTVRPDAVYEILDTSVAPRRVVAWAHHKDASAICAALNAMVPA